MCIAAHEADVVLHIRVNAHEVVAYADDPSLRILVVIENDQRLMALPSQLTMPRTAWKEEMPEELLEILRRRMPKDLIRQLLLGNTENEREDTFALAKV